MKRLLMTLVLAVILTLGCLATAAPARPLVFDEAGLLSTEEAALLQELLLSLSDQLSHDVAFASVDGTEGQQLKFYAADFFDRQGIGESFGESGALLVADMGSRSVYLATGGDLIDILTDERIDDILDQALDQSGWYAAALSYARAVQSYVEQGVPEGQHRFETEPNRPAAPDSPTPAPRRSVDLASLLLSGVLALGVGGAGCGAVAHRYRQPARQAYNAQAKSKLDLTEQSDRFLRQAVTTRIIRRNPPPSSGGSGGISRSTRGASSGRSTTFRSSSGRSHGGGGRRF